LGNSRKEYQYNYYTGQETQIWLAYALACKYINIEDYDKLYDKYEHIIAMLTNMTTKPEQWRF